MKLVTALFSLFFVVNANAAAYFGMDELMTFKNQKFVLKWTMLEGMPANSRMDLSVLVVLQDPKSKPGRHLLRKNVKVEKQGLEIPMKDILAVVEKGRGSFDTLHFENLSLNISVRRPGYKSALNQTIDILPVLLRVDATSRFSLTAKKTQAAGEFFLSGCLPSSILITRHLEKTGGGDTAVLTEEGMARAKELARNLGDADLAAIFVTELPRTQLTAAPLAQIKNMTPIVWPRDEIRGLAKRLMTDFCRRNVLVVSHSTTIPGLTAALGFKRGISMSHEWGDLWMIQFEEGRPYVTMKFHFGLLPNEKPPEPVRIPEKYDENLPQNLPPVPVIVPEQEQSFNQ